MSVARAQVVTATAERDQALDPAPREEVLQRALGYTFSTGNAVRRLKNGDEIFPEMLDAVKNAQHTIAFITFVYWTGDIAETFASALAEAAHRGVTVMIVLDAVGAAKMRPELVERLERAGAQVVWFRPKSTWRIWRISHRTHRKLLVVDHAVAYTGGVGIAKEWEGDGKRPGCWRDDHFRIEGPAVETLWSAFVGSWMETVHTLPLGWSEPRATPTKDRRHPGNTSLQVIRGTASVGWSDIATALHATISLAESRIRIQTAYFMPDTHLNRLLIDKARSGVEVQVLVPGPHQDQALVALANDERIIPLLDAGVEFHTYMPSMMHAKIVTVDGVLAMFGSANFNYRSLRKDDELILTTSDTQLVAQLDADFDEDLELCERIQPGDVVSRPWYRRLFSKVVASFRTEL